MKKVAEKRSAPARLSRDCEGDAVPVAHQLLAACFFRSLQGDRVGSRAPNRDQRTRFEVDFEPQTRWSILTGHRKPSTLSRFLVPPKEHINRLGAVTRVTLPESFQRKTQLMRFFPLPLRTTTHSPCAGPAKTFNGPNDETERIKAGPHATLG